VGTKKGFVVTWFTYQNSQAGVFGKFPAAPVAALLDVVDPPQAASRPAAAAEALTIPAPLSSRRRLGPSFMFKVSMASSTLGSIFIYLPPGV